MTAASQSPQQRSLLALLEQARDERAVGRLLVQCSALAQGLSGEAAYRWRCAVNDVLQQVADRLGLSRFEKGWVLFTKDGGWHLFDRNLTLSSPNPVAEAVTPAETGR